MDLMSDFSNQQLGRRPFHKAKAYGCNGNEGQVGADGESGVDKGRLLAQAVLV